MSGSGHKVDVLLVAYAPPNGAIAEILSAIARDLSAITRVAVLAPEGLVMDAAGAVDDIRFNYSSRRPDRAIFGSGWRAHRRAAALSPRVVLLFTQHPLNIVTAAHLRKSNLSMWWHEPRPRGQVHRLKALVYRLHDSVIAPRCTRILVAAPSVLADVPSRLRGKTSVVPFATMPEFAVDSARFSDTPSDVLYFGKVATYKGLDVLASALSLLDANGSRPRVRLIGAGSLSESAPKMVAFIHEHPGQIEHLDEYASPGDVGSALAVTKVVVLPYLSAAGSSTIAIVGMHGAALVASRCGCFDDFVVDEASGLLVAPGDAEELSRALSRLLGDDDLRKRLGAGLQSVARSTFDPRVVAESLLGALGIDVPAVRDPGGSPSGTVAFDQ
jgi:glycosyltransferase involved in cell wall biosynthesis